ncbi:MAG: hypothetical protein DPW18_16705 [Chloroflexi bacterium]|nr:hypothetical protein [Chloroflexota bacterium]
MDGDQPVPTLTPTAVVTPQILVHQPKYNWQVRYDDFSDDSREWRLLFSQGKLELINGRLILQSYVKGKIGIATSYSLFAPNTDKYYVQADFTTDAKTYDSYGLVFGLDKSLGTFYVFEILPQFQSVRLVKYTADQWYNLVPATPVTISPYPEATTLSVYFDDGDIKLYVNGNLAAAFKDDNPPQSANVGAFISDTSVRLIVDNFFVYDDNK